MNYDSRYLPSSNTMMPDPRSHDISIDNSFESWGRVSRILFGVLRKCTSWWEIVQTTQLTKDYWHTVTEDLPTDLSFDVEVYCSFFFIELDTRQVLSLRRYENVIYTNTIWTFICLYWIYSDIKCQCFFSSTYLNIPFILLCSFLRSK